MNAPEDGGPAFPRPASEVPLEFLPDQKGMSLRDYIAAKAMAAQMTMWANPEALQGFLDVAIREGHTPNEQLAVDAYRRADALLAERAKVKP